MKKAIISIVILTIISCTGISAKKIAIKGEVQDEYGRPVSNLSISVNKTSYGFGNNLFNLNVNDNDTLHFELDSEDKKDTVLSDSEVYHIISVKLSVDSSDGYYSSYPPSFQGNKFSINNFINKNLRYPEDALKDSISGVAHVRFRMNEYGERNDYSVIPSISPSLDMEAIRLVSLMPKMLPIRNGNMYKVANCFIPIQFNVNDYLLSKKSSITNSDSTVVKEYNIEELNETWRNTKLPDYPGGTNKMMDFISKNIKYPKDAVKKNVSAKVLLRFKVDCEGNIKNITIIQSAYPALDEEAIRVLKKMPRWNPGMNGSQPVSAMYTLPIHFNLK